MVVGLVLQGTQVMNTDPLAVIIKDVEESLDDAQDDFEGIFPSFILFLYS